MRKISKQKVAIVEKALLDFLKKTKDGKYAKIEESSLDYARIEEQDNQPVLVPEEIYYYSVS